MGKMYVAFSGT